MWYNYLKVAFRHYRSNSFYASLNLLGLAIGFAAFALIFIYVHYERSFEDFHTQSDRIYRLTYQYSSGQDFEVHWARAPFDYINELPTEFPEIKKLIRFQNQERKYVRIGDKKFKPNHAYLTDSDVFEVFDFPLIAGNSQTALASPYSIVISESLAATYFGETDPMGAELSVVGEYSTEEHAYTITGVMQDVPANSHLPADLFFSYKDSSERNWWAYAYLFLAEGSDISTVEAKMEAFVQKHANEQEVAHTSFHFQALSDIHLTSHLAREIVPNGNGRNVSIFFFVGLFILLIALINYLNLSSALSLGRSKEVGMRLILGSGKGQLIRFALLESVCYNLLAAGMSLLMVWIAWPYFHSLTDAHLLFPLWQLAGGLLVLAVCCGLLAGIYPAFVLTAAPSLHMLRHSQSFNLIHGKSAFQVKRLLVMLQFCASVLLIASAGIAWLQIRFLSDKNLGMTQEQVIAIAGVPNPVTDGYPSFRDRVRPIAGVQQVAACMEVPSREIRDVGPLVVQGRSSDPETTPMVDIQVISPGFLETMGIELLAGEDRSGERPLASAPAFTETYTPKQYLNEQPRNYLINETAMRQLGWESPEEALGQQISWSIANFQLAVGPITGVVKDFHQESLRNTVDPVLMVVEPIWLRTFLVKIETDEVQQTLSQIQAAWDELYPAYPMEYHFVDELYDQLYQEERIQLNLLLVFSGLAIFVAFLGLFGLVAYSLRTRLREIAIRRILGAGIPALIRLISLEYLIVLLIGGAIAIPLSYIWAKDWLLGFAYRVEISPVPYVLTLALVGGLLLLTIGLQTWRTASLDPADTLREE